MADIDLTRLCSGNSNINLNLYEQNLKDSFECDCGHPDETMSHYLPDRNLFEDARLDPIGVVGHEKWNLNYLLHGSSLRYSDAANRVLYNTVLSYITATGRFT